MSRNNTFFDSDWILSPMSLAPSVVADNLAFITSADTALEFPEMKDDIALLISAESYMNRLVDFRHRVIANKGMSRGMAYELNELRASNEAFGNPMMFTESVSSIGYEPSLEAIDLKLWAMVVAAIAFVVGLIYKFINWIFGDGDGGSSGGGSVESKLTKATEGAKETEKNFKLQGPIITHVIKAAQKVPSVKQTIQVPKVQNLVSIENSRIPTAIKEDIVAKAIDVGQSNAHLQSNIEAKIDLEFSLKDALFVFEEGSSAYEAIHNPNRYARLIYADNHESVKLLLASFDGFAAVSKILVSQLDLVSDIIADLNEAEVMPLSGGNVRAAVSLASLDKLKLDSSILDFDGHKFDSATQWAEELKRQLEDTPKVPLFGDLEDMMVGFERGRYRLEHVNFNGIITFFELLQKGVPLMMKLSKMAEERKGNVSAHKSARNDQGALIISVSKALSSNMNGAMHVYSIISKVYREVYVHGMQLMEAIRKNSSHIIAVYNRFDEMVPPTLEEYHEQLLESMGEYKKVEIAQRSHREVPHVHIDKVRISIAPADGSDPELDETNSVEMGYEAGRMMHRYVFGEPGKDDD